MYVTICYLFQILIPTIDVIVMQHKCAWMTINSKEETIDLFIFK